MTKRYPYSLPLAIFLCGIHMAVTAVQIDKHNTGISEYGEEDLYEQCELAEADVDRIRMSVPIEERPNHDIMRLNRRMWCLTSARVWKIMGELGTRTTWEDFWHAEGAAYEILLHFKYNDPKLWIHEMPELHTLLTAADIAYSGRSSPRIREGPKVRPSKLGEISHEELAAIIGRCEFSERYIERYLERARDFELATESYMRILLTTACKMVHKNPHVLEADLLAALSKRSDELALERKAIPSG